MPFPTSSRSRRWRGAGTLGLAALLLGAGAPAGGQDLGDVTRRIPAKRLRASSGLFDPESNRDAVPIEPGQTVTLAELDGPGEIRHLWFTIGALDRRFTRSLVLRLYWDGAETPSVESPIGDFFAAGNGMRANVSSLPIEVTSYGRAFNSYWRMPFRKHARVTMTNESSLPVGACYYYVDWLKFETLPADALYFHARYGQEFPPAPFTSYTVADIKGEGHYVGTVLSIHSSMGHWLGESDDRFYVDGEQTPSIVGTGLEDYFTDAWNLRLFTNLRAGVPIYEPKGQDQRATFYRWHVADPITFTKSLKVEIERRSFAGLVDPATGKEVIWDFKYRPDSFSSVACWYASGPAPRFWPFPPLRERVTPEIFVETTLMTDKLETGPGTTVSQEVTRSSNAAGGILRKLMTYVENGSVGGWIEVPIEVKEPGLYSISVYQFLWSDYGIWRVTLRGPDFDQLLDPAMDFFDSLAAERSNMPENHLYGTWRENKVGIHRLSPGAYTMRFECVGASALSRKPGSRYTYVGTRLLDPANAGQTGFNMALDGISLRKLPWDDNWAWMQDYLRREETLFAERVATAKATVARLARAIEQFRTDHGEYPTTLDELVARPARLKGRTGRWPYVEAAALAFDPWRQPYRYRVPGERNPNAFDVFSVHGNEREPAGWIGNWEDPAKAMKP